MPEQVTHEIQLSAGTRVVFGRRILASDLFKLDGDPQANNPTQYNDLIVRAHITEFGANKMPVPLTTLLDLDSVDREDLLDGCNAYQAMSAEGRSGEFLADHKVKLGWGFIVNDVSYTLVQFGKRITGRDEVEADKLDLKAGIRRACFLMGRQITSVASEDGTAELSGPIPLSYFESLDGADVATLRGGAEVWRQSFRVGGAKVSRNGHGKDSSRAGAEVRVERGAGVESAGGTA